MEIYLPIAEIPVNIIWIILLGVAGGFMAGMFGIGGGFIMTPILIFMGVSPAVAVASSANQIIASSVSGFRSHNRRGNVDFQIGNYMLYGGIVGAFLGTWIFSVLKKIGQVDIIISVSYFLFLGVIGALMTIESYKEFTRFKNNNAENGKTKKSYFSKLPMQRYFPKSDIKASIILAILIGVGSGFIVSILGIGGGFLTIPAMIYLLNMPTALVVGTSLYQMIIVTASVTFLHAYQSQTVDIVLAVLLLIGSVIGVHFGTKTSYKISPVKLRGLLALIILGVAFKMGLNLFIEPQNLYSVIEK